MVWKKDYNEIYSKSTRKTFTAGQIVRVCGSVAGSQARVGTICVIIRKGAGNHYWVKFEDEKEMIFRGAWLESIT